MVIFVICDAGNEIVYTHI